MTIAALVISGLAIGLAIGTEIQARATWAQLQSRIEKLERMSPPA